MYHLSSSSLPSIRTWDQLRGETLAGKTAHCNVKRINRVGGFWIDQYNHWWNRLSHIAETRQSWNYNTKFTKEIHIRQLDLVLATGPGNPPAVRVCTGKTVPFSSRPIKKPDQFLLGSPNPAPYLLTRGFPWVWLDPSGPISGFAFWVILFMVTFRYPTVNRKILAMVHRCSFWMYWPPLWSKNVKKCSLPHPGNERQWSVNDFRSCILGNLSGHLLQIVITEILATFIGKRRSDTLLAPSWKWGSDERQRFQVSHLV